jgi:hypothetical protein
MYPAHLWSDAPGHDENPPEQKSGPKDRTSLEEPTCAAMSVPTESAERNTRMTEQSNGASQA